MIGAVGDAQSFGGGYPATIWQDFMTRALAAQPARFPALSFAHIPAPAGWYRPWVSHVTG
jgi:hypothetical protein